MITLEDAIKMLEARLDCMHRSSSGIDVDCNREKCDDCDLNYAQGTVGEQQEALKEAISALEKQMPTIEPEQKVEGLLPDGTLHLFTDTDLSKVGRVLVSQNGTHYGDLYYADGDRKTGKWIEQDDGWDGVYYECSVCKEAFTLIDGNPSDNLYNFCPNCGADMRMR